MMSQNVVFSENSKPDSVLNHTTYIRYCKTDNNMYYETILPVLTLSFFRSCHETFLWYFSL